MVDRYPSVKFGVNPLNFSEKTMSTDDRRGTTDAYVMTVALMCSSTKQS